LKTIILASPNQYGYFTIYYNYAKYISKDYRVTYVCFDQGETKFEPDENVKVNYIPLSRNKTSNLYNYYHEIFKAYRSESSAVIILKYYYFSSILNLFISRRDLVLDIRTGYTSHSRIKTTYYNCIIRIESLFFKRIILLSESLRKRLRIRINKATIIPLGAERVEINSKRFTGISMLYVGTLTSRNIDQTVEGLALFLKDKIKNLNIRYHIVGGGKPSEVEKLEGTIVRCNLKNIVHYEGQIYGEKLKDFLMQCNVGISYIPVTKDYDCQPATKTIEYLMAGMAVIATETFENKLIITESNGVLVQDDPQSFESGLRKIISLKDSFNSQIISESVREYSYGYIIENKLKPILFSE
jgi:glycosyltransferase involved in cell wall biosynthesis